MSEIKIPKGTQYRTVVIERGPLTERAEGDERIPISLSSEAPVERWFGKEILDHGREAIDLTYAADGLPFLLDHNTREQIGLIEDITVGADRRLRGLVRFSKSARAQEILQDIVDGIRKNISVGYQVREMKLEASDKEAGDTYRASRWCPMEGSLVPIPADISVGVGRSLSDPPPEQTPAAVPAEVTASQAPKADTREERSMSTTAAPAGASNGTAGVTGGDPTALTEGQRLGQLARAHGATDLLPAWLERSLTVAQAKDELLERKRVTAEPVGTDNPLDLSPKDNKEFSLGRALKAQITGNEKEAGYERAISAALATRIGMAPAGFYMPTTQKLSVRTSLSAAGSTTGSKLVFTEAATFIEILRNMSVIMGLNPTFLPGLQGNLALPRQATAGTAAWAAELNGGSDYSESNLTVDQVTLSPKNIAATQSYSKQLFVQSVEAIDALVTADIFAIMARLFDLGCIHGTGASNQITGLYAQSGVNTVAMGGAITFAKVVDMEAAVEADNAALAGLAYITTPEVKGKAKLTEKFSSTGMTLWNGSIDGEMNGYRALASNQVSKVLGAGAEHGIVYGAFSQALVADWGAVDITIDNLTKARQGVVNITGFHLVDFAVRHPESFCKGTGLTAA